MPQKRNPVVLEHLRARLSRLLGYSQTIVIQCHNIPYGDTQDIEDEIEPTVFGAIATAEDILHVYGVVVDTLELDVDHLKAHAAAGFTTVTELADVLVREAHLPFRTAHHLVSILVSWVTEHNLTPNDITVDLLAEIAQEVLPAPLRLPPETIRRALDPVAFVQARTTLGGAAPSATAAVLDTQASQLTTDEAWLDGEQQRLGTAEIYLSEQVAELLAA